MSTSSSQYLSSLYSLDGKTALISGGTRGIGSNLAYALASAGANIILLARSPSDETVQNVRSQIASLGRSVTVHQCDLLERKSYLTLIEEIGGTVDIFVHCAGLQHRAPAVDFPEEKWDAILEVNLTAGFLIARALAKTWTKALENSDQSSLPRGSFKHVVFISSVLSHHSGSARVPAYVATKGSLHQLTKALSNEWASKGICVNALAPGYFETELTAGIRADPEYEKSFISRVPMGRWGNEGDLEGAIVWLSSRGSEFVSGETITVDGGFTGK
ncbi:MAG: hypothetical protein Q9227_004891 [Pyrenula ochraceoflavens]